MNPNKRSHKRLVILPPSKPYRTKYTESRGVRGKRPKPKFVTDFLNSIGVLPEPEGDTEPDGNDNN